MGGVNSIDLLLDGFGRVRGAVYAAVSDLPSDQLGRRIDPQANSIAWLVWHLTRVQDDHVAEVVGAPQVWTAQGWADRFALPFDPAAIGYGHSSAEVAAVRTGADLLLGYHDAVYEQTLRHLRGIGVDDLDRVVDEAWDPPVTLGVRLMSVLNDDLQHAGQAGFVRGVLHRAG